MHATARHPRARLCTLIYHNPHDKTPPRHPSNHSQSTPPPPNTGSITIYEPLNTQRTEEAEAAILQESLRRGRSKEHLKTVRRRCLGAERRLEEAQAAEAGGVGQSPLLQERGGKKRRQGYILVVRFVFCFWVCRSVCVYRCVCVCVCRT
jgi:hypothetical protein